MKTQNYYANFPSKLYQMKFKSVRDRTYHFAAMALVMGYVHTGDGYFYMSASRLAKEIGCSKGKAIEIIRNFIKWGFWIIVEKAKNQHSDSVYKLSTYDWNLVLEEEEKFESNNVDLEGNLRPAKRPAKYTSENKEYQTLEQISKPATRPAKRPITNNELTNNEITNNEEKEKFESFNVDFEEETRPVEEAKSTDAPEPIKQFDPDIELEIERPAYLVTELPREENINPKQLETELSRLISIYPKKSGNYRRLRDRYRYLRLKKKLRFEEIYEAVNGYILEMDSQGIEQKYWKTLDTLLDPVELDPWLYKPVISIDKKGKRFKGEFCIATRVIRYHVPWLDRIETQILDERKVDQMMEEERLIFLEKESLKEVEKHAA